MMQEHTEVRWQPEQGATYLGSPSIVKLDDGAIIVSHDYFCHRSYFGVTPDRISTISEVYRSEDDGLTFTNISHISGAFWGTLFTLNGKLWHISCRCEYGDVLLRCSEDGGYSWSIPADEKTGLLFHGNSGTGSPNLHFGGATPVYVANGRIYKACEDYQNSVSWNAGKFAAGVISAPVDCDLLDAKNWMFSNLLRFPYQAANEIFPGIANENSGWLEGSVVPGPDGGLLDVMRVHLNTNNHAAILHLSDDGKNLTFDPATGIVDFPGGASKFTTRRDVRTGLYFTLTNPVTDSAYPWQRNTLALACTADLRTWKTLCTVFYDDSGLTGAKSCELTGFQYPDWQFDGEDIIAAVRVAYNGAHSYHDSNRIWFKRIRNFRALVK